MMNVNTARQMAAYFSIMNREQLSASAASPDVSMTYATMAALQSFFNHSQLRPPSQGEMIFIDSFVSSQANNLNRYAAGEIRINEPYIAETLADVMAKYAELSPNYVLPCTALKAFELAKEIIDRNKIRHFSMSEYRQFTASSDTLASLNAIIAGCSPELCQNGICIAKNRYAAAPHRGLRSRTGYDVTIVYSNDENADNRLLGFAESRFAFNGATSVIVDRTQNIFRRIAEISRSLKVNTDLLPPRQCEDGDDILLTEAEKAFILLSDSFFTENVFGKHVFAIISTPSQTQNIRARAKKAGVETCSAIAITKEMKLKITSKGITISELHPDLFKILLGTDILKVDIPKQVLTDASDFDFTRNILTLSTPGERVYTLSLPLSDSEARFADAARAIFSLYISAAYDGFNAKNSDFSLAVRAALPMSDKANIGQSYAALLGIYRAVTELGTDIESYSLSAEGEPLLSLSLRVHSFAEKATLVTDLSRGELENSLREENGLPKFALLRTLINGCDQ